MKQHLISGFCLALSLTSLSLDAVAARVMSPEEMASQKTRLQDEIARLSQPLTCQSDRDCASIEMGAKPCGGPWKHVLYSKKNAKAPALQKKIADYNKLDKLINETQQMMSDCSMALPPEPKCVNKMCVDSAAKPQR